MITKEDIKKEIQDKLKELDRIMLGLNAYGSLDLVDYNIFISYLKGSMDYEVEIDIEP